MRQGCHSAYLRAFSWQARPFYEKSGYVVFAELDNFPGTQKRCFMRKRLQAGGIADPPEDPPQRPSRGGM